MTGTTVHVGVFTDSTDVSRLDGTGWMTDEDSFLVWGEAPEWGDPVHIQTTFIYRPSLKAVALLRNSVTYLLEPGERLADYVVLTDTEDWSSDVEVCLLDGTSVRERAETELDLCIEPPKQPGLLARVFGSL